MSRVARDNQTRRHSLRSGRKLRQRCRGFSVLKDTRERHRHARPLPAAFSSASVHSKHVTLAHAPITLSACVKENNREEICFCHCRCRHDWSGLACLARVCDDNHHRQDECRSAAHGLLVAASPLSRPSASRWPHHHHSSRSGLHRTHGREAWSLWASRREQGSRLPLSVGLRA